MKRISWLAWAALAWSIGAGLNAVVLFVMPTEAAAATFTTFDVPGSNNVCPSPSSSCGTLPADISPRGDIVGSYGDGFTFHGFQLHQGVFTTIDVPGATATGAFGINPQGDIVGGYKDGGGTEHGFLLHQGVFTTIDVPGATATTAHGINPQGDIVGEYRAGGPSHGFLLHQGVFTTIDMPGFRATRPFGINPQGDIVGVVGPYPKCEGGNGIEPCHGFLLHQGVFTTIDVPSATLGTAAFGINPQGDIVGEYVEGDCKTSCPVHGFLLHQGVFTTIDAGAGGTRAHGINPQGDIVGAYSPGGLVVRGFLRVGRN